MADIREQERRLEMQQKIIEEERQRLLREHAPKLVGYLPKVRIDLFLTPQSVRAVSRERIETAQCCVCGSQQDFYEKRGCVCWGGLLCPTLTLEPQFRL